MYSGRCMKTAILQRCHLCGCEAFRDIHIYIYLYNHCFVLFLLLCFVPKTFGDVPYLLICSSVFFLNCCHFWLILLLPHVLPLRPSFPSVAVVAAKKECICYLLLASLLLIMLNIYILVFLGLHMTFRIDIP